jgi:hypothetical protein
VFESIVRKGSEKNKTSLVQAVEIRASRTVI